MEFDTPREIAHRYGVHREIRGGWLNIKQGQVSVDTAMALALAEAILADSGEVRALSCAVAFDGWMRRKPVDIGNTVRCNLIAFQHTGCPSASPSEYDNGNLVAMRTLPVALGTLARDEPSVRALVHALAHVTHNNPASDAACEFITMAVQDFVRGEPLGYVYRQRIKPLIDRHPEFNFRGRRREHPCGWIVETIQAALQAQMHTDCFEDCLVDAVNLAGDADTTAAIVGMLAGALYGLEEFTHVGSRRLIRG